MIFVLIIILGLVLDQFSKWLIVQNLPLGASQDILGNLLRLHHVQNTGAAWSLFRDSTFALAIFSVLLLALLVVWFFSTSPVHRGQRLALSVIISGALGNMLDRFRLGYVVDFLELPHWPVFNVADMLLCCGVAVLALLILLEERQEQRLDKNKK